MTVKYITYQDGDRFNKFITFDDMTNHSDHQGIGRILGAGFVSLATITNGDGSEDVVYQCYGSSFSLGIDSRGEKDSDILNRYIDS